jgi:endonuclease YncB( thermonuclease family)
MHKVKSSVPALLLAISIAGGTAYSQTVSSGTRGRPVETERKSVGEVVKRVMDGDTFELTSGKRVRLIGVDTPEKGEPFADVARDFADSALVGSTVRIEYDKLREDNYERVLGYVFLDTVLFNELLIRRGLAHVYLFKENKRFMKRLISAQRKARAEKQGIWSQEKPSDEPYYIAAGGSYRFHRPLCTLIKNINLKKAKRHKTREAALDEGLSPCRTCRP